ncbi:MAG: benzoate/H(+) symporter BenE family transporter [Burkholderiaceae bacterium]|nr:benzoate/H(+) symporter BenE family transporter [Burkholderiaceae bacterium]
MRLLRDFSLSSIVAGFVAVLVGFTSSAVIVFEAARAAGATPAQVASWLWALGLGMGLTTLVLSLRYRMPVLTAWSTPGAALLITSVAGLPLAQTIGAFVVTGLLIVAVGASGVFERLMQRIPIALAAGMLAGVLLRFGLDAFVAMKTQLLLAGGMFAAYLVARQRWPRYAVPAALLTGIGIAAAQGLFAPIALEAAGGVLTRPQFVMPQFSLAAVIGVALPLFVVTMASQNVPGVATLRAHGYAPPLSPVITTTGVATTLLAPFGGYALNLAAITAAICMGREAHPDADKRYTAAVAAGVFYLLLGLFAATVTALFAAFPRELVMAIAGLALLGTIGNGLAAALADDTQREAALVTFLVTASGLTLWSIGSAFWGLVAGLLALAARRWLARG